VSFDVVDAIAGDAGRFHERFGFVAGPSVPIASTGE
jgi:hypothetical protein